eukprot:SAG25_NODE_7752_length_462_cov_0.440771_1_plen_137_part_01
MDMGQKQLGRFATFHLINIWRFEKDLDWARTTGYPLLRGIALFWQCVLVRVETPDGKHYWNDASDCDNELCAPSGKPVGGITLVLSMLPALFQTVGEIAHALGGLETAARRAVWADIAAHVKPYATTTLDNNTIFQV